MSILDKIPKGIQKLGMYYSIEFYFSEAYQTLPKGARNLLQCMIGELRYNYTKKRNSRNRTKVYPNNGTISFTEVQFKKLLGSSSQTYINSRNKLIEVGFIRQTHRGGKCRGDMSKYKVLCVEDVPYREQRWRKYPKENWTEEIPKRKNTLVGVETRFQKGKSGRKTKPTLLK